MNKPEPIGMLAVLADIGARFAAESKRIDEEARTVALPAVEPEPCDNCGGAGEVVVLDDGHDEWWNKCPKCEGSGEARR